MHFVRESPFLLLLGILALCASGCHTVKKYVVVGAEPILNDVNQAIFAQSDLKLIKMGLPGNILMVEGLVRSSPENREVLVLACQAFTGLAFLTEDDDPKHAAELYERGRDYGMRALRLHDDFREALDNGQSFEEAIKLVDSESYLPALLWTGLSWAQTINLRLDDPMESINGSKVKAIMDRIISIDTEYFYGLAHVIVGAYYVLMPNIFVGGPDVVDKEFQFVFNLTKGKFLIAKVYYARYYATLIMDEALYDSVLKEVIDTPPEVDPNIGFLNALAVQKAKVLLNCKEKYF